MKIEYWKSHETDDWHWQLTTDKGRLVSAGNVKEKAVCMLNVDMLKKQHPEASVTYRDKPGN
jgi:hypothetical protein